MKGASAGDRGHGRTAATADATTDEKEDNESGTGDERGEASERSAMSGVEHVSNSPRTRRGAYIKCLPKKDCRTDEGTFILRRFYKSNYRTPRGSTN